MSTPVKTAFQKITPKVIKPQPWTIPAGAAATPSVTPTVTPAAAESPPAKPKVKLKPCSVSVYLQVVEGGPDRQGLGAAYLKDCRDTPGVRAIGLKVFRERLLISRALQKQDEVVLRFAASLLLAEFVVYSRAATQPEVQRIGEALKKALGAPWPFAENLTFMVCELARHDMSALKEGLFLPTVGPSVPWLVLDAILPEPSTLSQWNPAIPGKPRKPNKAPEGEKS